MRHSLIREFAKENFGPSYYVVPHGQDMTFQPLALIIKEGGPFRGSRRVVMETIDKYLVDDSNLKAEVQKAIEKNLVLGEERQMDGKVLATSTRQVAMESEFVNATAKKDVNYGRLQLGCVEEEFFRDMGLREILRKAKLDVAKMSPYEKKKFYLITNVVYSAKLEITGEREQTEEVDARIAFPRFDWLSKMKAGVSVLSKTKPPSALGRQERSPLLFTYAKVKYNPESQLLELKDLVGAKVRKKGIGQYEDVVPDNSGSNKGEKYFISKEFCVFDDLIRCAEKNRDTLQVMTKIFQETQSFSDTKIMIKKFLNLASMATSKDGKRLTVEVPMSSAEKNLLRSVGIQLDTQNSATTLQVPCSKKSQVQAFIQILHIFDDIKEDEWRKIKAFMANNEEIETTD